MGATAVAIASGVVSIAKAIPAVGKIIDLVVAQYYSIEEGADQTHMNEVQKERDMLIAAIRQPGMTDAQKRVARKRLIALTAE